jgi:hypothetical protein
LDWVLALYVCRSTFASTTSKPIDYPYGMLMNASKGQIGSSAFMGTNAMISHPVYTVPITSVPQTTKIND